MVKGYSPISGQESDGSYREDSQFIDNELNTEPNMIDFKAVIPETKNLDQFITIDRIAEENSPILTGAGSKRAYSTRHRLNSVGSETSREENITYHNERIHFNSKYGKYKELMWDRCKTFITLTTVAITIGCFAGFIQIFTETLVNWKTGHCARNFLLNKSFCCSNVESVSDSITSRSILNPLMKRQEIECIDQGYWIEWTGSVSPFIIFIFLSILFATISTLLVKYVAPMATGSGISEIKVWVSGFEYKSEFLNTATLIVKSVALPLAISAGLALGKEGPSVHYATCCAFIVTKWLLKDNLTYSSQFEYLTAGGGAGVAVAFGAPIGGVLFGLEELSSATDFNAQTLWKSYYVALIAVSTLKVIDPFRNGKIILFNVTYDKNWRVVELPVFIILGIFGGLYGKYISQLNIAYVNFRKRYLTRWATQEIVLLALITGLLSYFNEFLKLDMTESMGILFHECVSGEANEDTTTSYFEHKLCYLDEHTEMFEFLKMLFSLFYATFVRASLVIVSYGAKVPAGIFVPSMAVGATFGRAISLIVERFITGPGVITSGAYAFLGAAGALCGITNLTLTVVVIMLELTGAFIYIIPTMIVVAITRIIMSTSGTMGIADQMIMVNGFPILEMEEDEEKEGERLLSQYKAQDIMSKGLIVLNETMYISELEKMIYESGANNSVNGFPIVVNNDKTDPDMECIGYVLRRHLVQKLMMQDISSSNASRTLVHFNIKKVNETNPLEISFCDIVNSFPITVKLDTSSAVLFRLFKHNGCKAIMIENHGLLKGIITSKDIIRFQRSIFREKFGTRYHYNEQLNEKIWSVIQPVIKRVSGQSDS
ncbi:anion/proton exchange transporter Gef1p [Monosporozyma unispora]|nr:glycerol ethanol, ferric requiring protein [Kazachstania unispora]